MLIEIFKVQPDVEINYKYNADVNFIKTIQ